MFKTAVFCRAVISLQCLSFYLQFTFTFSSLIYLFYKTFNMLHFAVCCHCGPGKQEKPRRHRAGLSVPTDSTPSTTPHAPTTHTHTLTRDGSERGKSYVGLFPIMYNFPAAADWWVGNGRLAQRREDPEDSERGEAAFSDIAALHIPATDGNSVLRHPGATPGHPGIAQDQVGSRWASVRWP